ncbi:MAG: transketolase family protein [Anaerolineaceae bacterium]|nr:transketolase family protein [Anaerolineaceae bacterium]
MNDRMPDLTTGKPNLDVFAQTLTELAADDPNLIVITSDSRGSGRLTGFGERYPKQLIEVGIAEQNLVGIAAGLAASGKHVFAVSPACFLTARSLEQIKTDVAYSNHPVKLVGISAGVSYGALGSTHHSTHDLAALQAINNLDIMVPANNFETRAAIRAAVNHPRPMYLRFGKRPMPVDWGFDTRFEPGKAIQCTPERALYDAALIACGETVPIALDASRELAARGITSCVLSLHSIRPFDEQAVLEAAKRSKCVMTVEEHSVHGGLGSRVAGLLMQAGLYRPFRIIGIPDEPTFTGSQLDIFEHYGISSEGLSHTVLSLLESAGRE